MVAPILVLPLLVLRATAAHDTFGIRKSSLPQLGSVLNLIFGVEKADFSLNVEEVRLQNSLPLVENATTGPWPSLAARRLDSAPPAGGPTHLTGPGGALLEPALGEAFGLELHGGSLSERYRFLALPRSSRACGQGGRVGPAGLAGGQLLLAGPRATTPAFVLARTLSFAGLITMRFSLAPQTTPVGAADVLTFKDAGAVTVAFRLRLLEDLKIEVLIWEGDMFRTVACNVGFAVGSAKVVEVRLTDEKFLVRTLGSGACEMPGPSSFPIADSVEVHVGGDSGQAADAILSDLFFNVQVIEGVEEILVADDFQTKDSVRWVVDTGNEASVIWSGGEVSFVGTSFMRAVQTADRHATRLTVNATLKKASDCDDHFVALSLEPVLQQATELKFGWSCGVKQVTAPGKVVQTPCTPLSQNLAIRITMEVDGTVYFEDDTGCPTLVLDDVLADIAGDSLYIFLGGTSSTGAAAFVDFTVAVAEPFLVPASDGELSSNVLAWNDLALDLNEERAYRVCWCQEDEAAVVLDTRGLPVWPIEVYTAGELAGEAVTLLTGFKYHHLNRTADGVPWTLQRVLKWGAVAGSGNFDVYASPDEQFRGSGSLLLGQFEPVPLALNAFEPLADYRFLSVYTTSSERLGFVDLHDQHHYYSLSLVSDVSLSDTNNGSEVVGGVVRWTHVGASPYLTGYSLWISRDPWGLDRTVSIPPGQCEVPAGQDSLELPAEGIDIGDASYIIVYACNEAGEQHLGAAAQLVDMRPEKVGANCSGFDSFGTEVGIFAVGGFGFQLSDGSGAVSAAVGQVLELTLSSTRQLLGGDRISVVSMAVQCGGPGANVTDPHISLAGEAPTVISSSSLQWSAIASQPGEYRVCFCGLAVACDDAHSFSLDAGRFTFATLTGAEALPGADGKFELLVYGLGLSPGDRVTVVGDGVQCGEAGSGESLLDNPEVLFVEGEASSGSLRWTNLSASPGNYNVCWCGGLGNSCQGDAVFRAVAGSIVVVAPQTLTATTTTATSTATTITTITTFTNTTLATTTTTVTSTTATITTATTTTATTTTTPEVGRVLLVSLGFIVDAVGGQPSSAGSIFNSTWAESNWNLISTAISLLTGIPSSSILLEVNHSASPGFTLNLKFVLPDVDPPADAANAQDLERTMQALMGSNWATGGDTSWPLLLQLRALVVDSGGNVPWGLDNATADVASSPYVVMNYILPITTTVTTTSTVTILVHSCVSPPPLQSNSEGSYEHCVGMHHGGVCTINCREGYKAQGAFSCDNGTFVLSSSPACASVHCQPPTDLGVTVLLPNEIFLNGTRRDLVNVSCTGLDYQSTCTSGCAPGFIFDTLGGGSELVCGEDGTWSGNATCIPLGQSPSLRCIGEVPSFVTVEMPFGCKGPFFHGETCELQCVPGYALSGATALECNFGQWQTVPSNSALRCGPDSCLEAPVLLRGSRNLTDCMGAAHGSACEPRCQEGWKVYSGDIICDLGKWIVHSTCQEQELQQMGAQVQTIIEAGVAFQLDVEVDQEEEQKAIVAVVDFFNYGWALRNYQLLLETIASILGIDAAKVQLEILTLLQVQARSLLPTARALQTLKGAAEEGRGKELQAQESGAQTASAGQGRALQAEEAETGSFRMSIVFQAGSIFQGQNETELVRQLVERFFPPSNSSEGGDSDFPGLFETLSSALEAPLAGLESATVKRAGEPIYINELSMLRPQWFEGLWKPCDCSALVKTGGRSYQMRDIVCTVDHLDSCTGTLERPASQRTCECPTPPPLWGIPDNIKIVGGVGIFVFLCCVVCCYCEIRRFCRSVRYGERNLRDQKDISVSYTVQHPSRDRTPDGKVHVVWDINKDQVKALLNNRNVSDEDNPNLEVEAAGDEFQREETTLPVAGMPSTPRELQRRRGLDAACPAYDEGEKVEYYSKTHQCWLLGTVRLNIRYSEDGAPVAAYDVNVGRGNQWRCDVSLDMMRQPLTQADPVEVLCTRRRGSAWLPGALKGVQPAGATSLGYTVERDGQVLERVPAARLRRCFPEGSPVDVYRGPPRGWVPAMVVERRRGDGPMYPEPLGPYSPRPADAMDCEASRAQRLWIMVPITEDPDGTASVEDASELVPSYLLRLRSVFFVQPGEHADDRIFMF